jgi:hypothetical protein
MLVSPNHPSVAPESFPERATAIAVIGILLPMHKLAHFSTTLDLLHMFSYYLDLTVPYVPSKVPPTG